MFLASAILFIQNQMKMSIVQTRDVFIGTRRLFQPHWIYDQAVREDSRCTYDTCDTPHHALQEKYPLHDSKPGVVKSTAELISPPREMKEEMERKKKDRCQLLLFPKYSHNILYHDYISTACDCAVLIDYCVCM